MTLLFVFAGAALAISFTCSLLEATLLSFSSSQVAALEAKRPRIWKTWRGFKDNIDKPIAVILVTNTISHTIGATMAGAQVEKAELSLVAFSLIFTALMLQFTEILPKSLGVRYNAVLAPIIAPPLAMLTRVMAPILWVTHQLNRPFISKKPQEDTTLDEISGLAATARLSSVVDPDQAKMIQAASELDDLTLRNIMTPRTDVVFLRLSQPIGDVLEIIRDSPHTRLPVCNDTLDDVAGIVHIKDIFKALELMPGRIPPELFESRGEGLSSESLGTGEHVIGAGSIDLEKITRDAIVMPDTVNVLEALRRFQTERQHIAIVVDEYGATQGIVTLEDVLEEIVGEIEDEFDPAPQALIEKTPEGYCVNGRMPLRELNDHITQLGVDFMEESVDTVGGYVTQALGRFPEVGDTLEVGPHTWTVTSLDDNRVGEVAVVLTAGGESENDAAND